MSKSVWDRECIHAQPKTPDEERLTLRKTHEEVGKDGILEHTTLRRSKGRSTEVNEKKGGGKMLMLTWKGVAGRTAGGTSHPLSSIFIRKPEEGKVRGLMWWMGLMGMTDEDWRVKTD